MKSAIHFLSLVILIVTVLTLTSCERLFNKPPDISDQEFSVEETSPESTVIDTVEASDKADQALTFSIISGNDDDAFAISSCEGIIAVYREDVLDYETEPIREIIVMVTDEFGKSSTATITINVLDIKPTREGLVLYLPFDGNVNDASDSLNHGIDYTSGNYVEGVWGQALDFNGTTDYVILSETLNGKTGLTFSFWLKSRGAQPTENNGTVICKYDKDCDFRTFYVLSFGSHDTRSINKLGAYYYTDPDLANGKNDMCQSYITETELLASGYNTSLYDLTNKQYLEINTWVHCVANMTPTKLELWLNGELTTSKTREYNSYFETSSQPTYIGNCLAGGDGSNNHLNAVLDELRVYNRGLTAEEIRILFRE